MNKGMDIFGGTGKGLFAPFLVLAVLLLLRFILLGTYPLMDTTEARYADVARWMYVTGDYITPRYPLGEPFWGKPPLSFWFTAFSFKLFGLNELAARLPSLLLSAGTVFFTYLAASRVLKRAPAILSAIILSSCGVFFVLSGCVLTDTSLAFCTTLSMASIVMALTGDGGRADRLWGYAFFAGMGLSLLSKGPVGLILILFPVFIWALWRGRLGTLWRSLPWVGGILLMLLISAPWYIAAEVKTPGFLDYYFIGEHFKRFIEPGWSGDLYGNAHLSPKGIIWLYYLMALLPWVFVLAACLLKILKKGGLVKECLGGIWGPYLLCWTLAPIIFFTMAGNVLPTYVMPGLPAFAILSGEAISRASALRENSPPSRFLKPSALYLYASLVPLLFIIVSFTVLPQMGERKSQKRVGEYIKMHKSSEKDRIFYVDKLSFSADFYNNGRAEKLLDNDLPVVPDLLRDEGLSFFVIKDGQVELFLRYVSVGKDVRKESVFGKYTIYREI